MTVIMLPHYLANAPKRPSLLCLGGVLLLLQEKEKVLDLFPVIIITETAEEVLYL